jgi:hypothetical protein
MADHFAEGIADFLIMDEAVEAHPTHPTPLISAESTSHVLATSRFLNPRAALRARIHVFAINKVSEFLFKHLVTFLTLMPSKAT